MEYLDILYAFCSKDVNAMTKLIDSDTKFRELILDISRRPRVGYFLNPDVFGKPELKLEFIRISYEDGIPVIAINFDSYDYIHELHFRKKKKFLQGEYLEACFINSVSYNYQHTMSATVSKELYSAYKRWLGDDIKVQGYKLGDLATGIYLTMNKLEKDLAYRFADRNSIFKIDSSIDYNGTKFFSFSVKTGNNSYYIESKVLSGQLVFTVSSLTGSKHSQDVYYNLNR